MCSRRAVGTGTPSTRNSRRSAQTVSKSNPAITNVRSALNSPGPLTRLPGAYEIVCFGWKEEIEIFRDENGLAVGTIKIGARDIDQRVAHVTPRELGGERCERIGCVTFVERA